MKPVEKFLKKILLFFIRFLIPKKAKAGNTKNWKSFNRILVFRLDNRLGNSILILSLVQVIKHRAAHIQIDVMMTSRFVEIYQQHPDIREVIPYDQNYLLSAPWRYLSLIQKLRGRKYDVVFSSNNPNAFSISQAILARLITRHHAVGFDWQDSNRIYTDVVKGNTQIHYALAQVDLWRYFDPAAGYERPRLYFTLPDRSPENKLLFWLGATGNKKLPVELILELIDIFSVLKIRFELAAGPYDRDLVSGLPDIIQRQVVTLSGTLKETAAFFKQYTVICMPDTGPLHLAAALNIPLIQLFMGSNSTWYAYRGEDFLLIDKVLDIESMKTFIHKYFAVDV
jgi:heptosyltransferase-3